MGIRIITDSSADFYRATAKRRQVEIISMAVQFGNASFLDGKTITNDPSCPVCAAYVFTGRE